MFYRRIYVKFEKEGIHAYPEAATNPILKDVSFLANPHRHIFKFKVWMSVLHNERDVEFILLKRYCESLYNQNFLYLDNKSCETMAEELVVMLYRKYPYREITVQVSEDGENGAIIEYFPDYMPQNQNP